ncbi:MAG: Ig-like domain-containing protein [Longimicrobiaceae bacterium]
MRLQTLPRPGRMAAALLLAAAVLALPACKDTTGAKAGPAAHLDVLAGNAQTAPVLTELPQPLVVQVTDAQGHKVKGQVVNFVVTAGGGHVFAGTAITSNDGVAQERWTLGGVAGAPQTLEARAVDSATGQALVFATFTATATPGAPTQAGPYGPSATSGDTIVAGVTGSVVEDSFAVLVRDAQGNPVPGVQVGWAVTSGGGSITSPTTTDAAGVARTQWVLGTATGPVQTAQATVGSSTVRFSAYPATTLTKISGDGITAAAGSPVTLTVKALGGSGPIGDLPIHWTVASGGGSVTPAVGTTSKEAFSYGTASATWTLGGAAGTQTLTASAGNLSVTFSVNVLGAGQRTLLAQLPAGGAALDATPDRVLWLDGATRLVRVRTISNGSDANVKVDSVKNGDVFTWSVSGHLYTGGALVWNRFGELFDWHGGALAYLGQTNAGAPPSVDGDWASYSLSGTGLVLRDLAAATATVFPSGGSLSDVGPDGTLVYPGPSNTLVTYHNGTTTSAPTLSGAGQYGGFGSVLTDGVNNGYTTLTAATNQAYAFLSRPGGDEILLSNSLSHGGRLFYMLAGGWAAYGTQATVYRRAPGGTVTQLNPAGSTAVLQALSPSGAVVYSMNGQYYKAAANGTTEGVGPAVQGEQVVWRVDRFILLSGGAVYDLGS